MNMRSILFSLLLCAGVCAGCSPYPRTEAEFGDSVRHMVRSQQVNPDATEAEPVLSGDGQRIENVLGVYRSNAQYSTGSTEQPVTLELPSVTGQ